HYHLAVETPRGNLVAGIHWLQSTFGNRFNRFRGEHGRAFQGRYKAILVEPGKHLGRLVDYIHLNPVRAGIVPLASIGHFRWSSYRWLNKVATERPEYLDFSHWLDEGGFSDSPEGWRGYQAHLAALVLY